MGAEALLRGAQWVVGIEQSPQACQVIRDNWSAVAQPHQHTLVLRGDVRQKLPQVPIPQFDFIYFDPPTMVIYIYPFSSCFGRRSVSALRGKLLLSVAPKIHQI